MTWHVLGLVLGLLAALPIVPVMLRWLDRRAERRRCKRARFAASASLWLLNRRSRTDAGDAGRERRRAFDDALERFDRTTAERRRGGE